MRTIRRLSPALLAIAVLGNVACAPGEFGAGAKMANTILSGAACGMAAANETPCTPKAVLDALAKDAAAQREKVQALAPAAAAVDPATTQLLVEQMAANTESNKKLTAALIALIEKGAAAPAPSASATSSPTTPAAPLPAASPAGTPSASASAPLAPSAGPTPAVTP